MKIELNTTVSALAPDKESIHLTINGNYIALVMYNPTSEFESGNPYTAYFGYEIHRALKAHFNSLHSETSQDQ